MGGKHRKVKPKPVNKAQRANADAPTEPFPHLVDAVETMAAQARRDRHRRARDRYDR